MTGELGALTRVVDGRDVPAARRWVFEAGNSEIAFVVKHMMISKVRGSFRDFSGELVIGDRPEDSTATVSIVAESIDTGMAYRDRDLRSPDFLDIDQYKTLE